MWVFRNSLYNAHFWQGLCCLSSLAPGPGMASAAADSILDPEPPLVLSAKRKFLSVYQGLRKEAASEPLLLSGIVS